MRSRQYDQPRQAPAGAPLRPPLPALVSRDVEPIVVVHGGASSGTPEPPQGAPPAGALRTGFAALAAGGTAPDAVIAAVRVVEDDPACTARPNLVAIASYDSAFTDSGAGPSLLSALLIGDDEQTLRRLTELRLPADVGCSAANLDS